MSGSHNQASIGGIFGASGSGKSSLQKLELLELQPARLLLWDPKREYRRFGVAVETIEDLAKVVRRAKPFRVVFHPRRTRRQMKTQFNAFCTIGDRLGDPELGGTPLWLVADELADVTEPGWAPEGWERVTRQGRHAGLTIRGLSQRPADIDKSFYGNLTHIAVFRQNAEGDVDRLAKILRVPKESIGALRQLEWVERNLQTGELSPKKNLSPADLKRLSA